MHLDNSIWDECNDFGCFSLFRDVCTSKESVVNNVLGFNRISRLEVSLDLTTMQMEGAFYPELESDMIVEFLSHCETTNNLSDPISLSFDTDNRSYELEFKVHSYGLDSDRGCMVKMDVTAFAFICDKQPKYLQEHYINGCRDSRRFDSHLFVESYGTYCLPFVGDDADGCIRCVPGILNAGSYRVMLLESDSFTAYAYMDNKSEFGDRHHRPMTVLYVGTIPDDNKRRMISDFLSFYIGSNLIKIGETGFDDEGCCYVRRIPAFRFHPYIEYGIWPAIPETVPIGDLFKTVYPKFVELYDRYQLELFTVMYWRAINSERDLSMVQLLTCYELLEARYIEHHGLDTMAISKGDYKRIISPFIERIETELKEAGVHESGIKSILECIRGANSNSKRTGRRLFTESVGIEFDKEREKAYKMAMNLKHGEHKYDEIFESFVVLLGYVTEIFLRIIGYGGPLNLWEGFLKKDDS